MHRRLIFAFSLLVTLPLLGLTFLAVKVARDEREMAVVEWRNLLEGRLHDLSNSIAAETDAVEREAFRALDGIQVDVASLRRLVRTSPLVSQAFLLGGDGQLRFPPDDATASDEERAFLARTRSIWERRAILYAPPQAEMPVPQQQISKNPEKARPARPKGAGDSLLDVAARQDFGWITWYWQEGLHLLLWRMQATGDVVGVEIDRVAALARIVGRLPDPSRVDGRIVLVGERGLAVVQWGPMEPEQSAEPAARIALSPPWDALRLAYYPSPTHQANFVGGSARWSLGLGLFAVILSVVGLAIYFYRESDREMREAAQRVTFVTQVSHELKTPLTNIRLYAELLDRDLDDEAEGARRRVATIVSEAQRLSRLISNILTFSRQRRGKLSVSPRAVAVDGLVESMVDQFRPALEASEIAVEIDLSASEPTLADPDTVDQILANLLSNVEKYASEGRWVRVATTQDDRYTHIDVEDRGPGISADHAERVFLPFYRISDRLSDGVTGTGIGLALSAELARKNGGRLGLVPTERGARFRLSLPRPRKGP